MNFTLKPLDLGIEAKRVPITKDVEKHTNNLLSDTNSSLAEIQSSINTVYHETIPWNDLSHLKNGGFSSFSSQYLKKTHVKVKIHNSISQQNEVILLKNLFYKWKSYIQNKKSHTQQLEAQLEQTEKLDNFLKSIKQYQHYKRPKTTIRLQNKSDFEEASKTKSISPKCSYKHRFKAQQDIIQSQKEKLVRQEKIIDELKLGKLHEDITRSLQETEKEIQALGKCSLKIKCKIKSAGIEAIQENYVQFQVNSTKVPKIVQMMEKRALERECRRQIILQRKIELDKRKKEAIQMEIEKKRVQDEEERKRNLEAIKVARKRELEIQQQIQLKKQNFLDNCMKADGFYKKKISKKAFKGFITLIQLKRNNALKSRQHFEQSLKKKCFDAWIEFLARIEARKCCKVDKLYHYKLKKKILRLWFNVHVLSIKNLQVANDLFEMQLLNRTFLHWHRYTCVQYIRHNKNLQKAHRHYKSRILLHYFYLWKSLPVVVQLEKAKEEKKRKWREKVWEILPDYQPLAED